MKTQYLFGKKLNSFSEFKNLIKENVEQDRLELDRILMRTLDSLSFQPDQLTDFFIQLDELRMDNQFGIKDIVAIKREHYDYGYDYLFLIGDEIKLDIENLIKVDGGYLIKIPKFLELIFPGEFGEKDKRSFVSHYIKAFRAKRVGGDSDNKGEKKKEQKEKSKEEKKKEKKVKKPSWFDDDDNPLEVTEITPRKFEYDPKNVRETFLSLVTETYPMGHEEEVVPLITPGLTRDKHGNYYTIIGDSDTAFTCHLDTASRDKSKINLFSFQEKQDSTLSTFFCSDRSTILGADDKAGVTILMYMIDHGIPGVYWFFMGEERGGIGSRKVADDYESYPFMQKIKKMVSFDRRNYHSVITAQSNRDCCSSEFAEALCGELKVDGFAGMKPDPTGVFTDSANFIKLIPECTNISVGYFNEHTGSELQNISFLENLAKACVKVEWGRLPVKRAIVQKKYKKIIDAIRKDRTFVDVDLDDDGKYLEIFIENYDISDVVLIMKKLQEMFQSEKITPEVVVTNGFIKITLK